MSLPVVAPLPAVIPVLEAKLDIPIKKIVLVITRDLDDEDKQLFKQFQVTEYDHDIHHNLPINSYEWEVLVLDIREKGDRYCYLREVTPQRDKYNVVVYCHKFESDVLENVDNEICKLPEKQARKEDFYNLLMQKRISKPRWYVSLFKCILNAYQQTKN